MHNGFFQTFWENREKVNACDLQGHELGLETSKSITYARLLLCY